MLVTILILTSFITGTPFLKFGDNLLGIADGETMAWTFNPVILENSSSASGFFFHNHYYNTFYSRFYLKETDYFNLNLVAPPVGTMLSKVNDSYGFAFSIISDRTSYSRVGSSTSGSSYSGTLKKLANTYISTAFFKKLNDNYTIGFGLDILEKSGDDLQIVESSSKIERADTNFRISIFEKRKSNSGTETKSRLYNFKFGAGINTDKFQIYPFLGVAVLSRNMNEFREFSQSVTQSSSWIDSSRIKVDYDTSFSKMSMRKGIDGRIPGFQIGATFDFRNVKGSIIFENLKGKFPLIYEYNSILNEKTWRYDTTGQDTSYYHIVLIRQLIGDVYGDSGFNTTYRRLKLNIGNAYSLTEKFDLYTGFGFEYLYANYSGSREFEVEVTGYSHDTSSTGWAYHDTLHFKRQESLGSAFDTGKIKRFSPSLNMAGVFKLKDNLSLGGIVSGGFINYKELPLDDWRTVSFFNFRFLVDFNVRNWEFVIKARDFLKLSFVDIYVMKRF